MRTGHAALSAAFSVVIVLTTLASPSRAQFFSSDKQLEEKVVAAEKRADAIEGSLRQLAAQIARLNSEKQELLQLVREFSGLLDDNAVADQKERDELHARYDELRGLIAQVDEQAGKADKRLSKLGEAGKGVEHRLANIEEELAQNAENLYREAWSNYQQGLPDTASGQFRLLLERHPDSELAASARYWIGMILLEQYNAVQAADEFSVLISTYPQSARVPAAMLALAEAHDNYGASGDAIVVRGELVARYPGSLAADKARLLLD